MDEDKKIINTRELTIDKTNASKIVTSNKKNKSILSIVMDKKRTNNIATNTFKNIKSAKNQSIPISDKNSISKTKKPNSIGFSNFQKRKLISNSSYKNLDFGKRTSILMNPANNKNFNSDAITYLKANNNSKLGYAADNTTNELNSKENSNLNNKEKENYSVNILNNTNATKPDPHIQRFSVVSGGNDLSINQPSLLEIKKILSPNGHNIVNAFSHQNSINNISTSTDSSHIKVTVRFRPMNNVENVRYFLKIKQLILILIFIQAI
jgi:hypothetical protein